MNWVPESLGALAVIFPPTTNRDHSRAAIQLLSNEVERREVYTHIGWRRLGERWAYLHAAGAITATGLENNVRVSLPGALQNFRLPSPPAGEELRVAVRASLGILDIAPDSLTVPMYAAIYRAPLGEVRHHGSYRRPYRRGKNGDGDAGAAALRQRFQLAKFGGCVVWNCEFAGGYRVHGEGCIARG